MGSLRLCCRGVWDHPSSGKNQGKLRTNQPQLTLAQDDERRRNFVSPDSSQETKLDTEEYGRLSRHDIIHG